MMPRNVFRRRISSRLVYMPIERGIGRSIIRTKGVPIYDLPAEYLAWFALKGFPEGKLGELLRLVYQTKADGCDGVFDAIRRKAGGRYKLRQPNKRAWKFE